MPRLAKKALKLVYCFDFTTLSGLINAFLKLKYVLFDDLPGKRIPFIHRLRRRIHSFCTPTFAFIFHLIGYTSAYP
jgi:hypothetical protein